MKNTWRVFAAELIGTALLLLGGLSVVILDFGSGSPVLRMIPDPGLRRLITGFLFGSTGALIAISPIGKISGAHINPVVTAAFWMEGKLRPGHALGYITAQLAGGILGTVPLLLWGHMGASIQYGATTPGSGYSNLAAVLGEMATTTALLVGLFTFIGHSRLASYTPLLFPFLYAVMVYLEAPLSGTSTNPARSLGPALVSGDWQAWWVYWIGPGLGLLIGVGLHKLTWLKRLEYEVAKLYHFEHDPYNIFKW
jgi:aquaporin Z